jgi:DnaK suppressor protein
MSTVPKTVRTRYQSLEKELSAQRDALLARFAEQRSEAFPEHEPDDECGEANRNLARHLILWTLDRERRVLQEIEVALQRMKSGLYGQCEICGMSIPDARLRALPWARSCVRCAERSPS